MSGRKLVSGTRIDHEDFVAQHALELFKTKQRRLNVGCRPSAVAIHALHDSEVPRWYRLVLENSGHEVAFVRFRERPVEQLLISHGGLRHRAKRLSAGRAGTVTRPDLQVTRLLRKFPDGSVQ